MVAWRTMYTAIITGATGRTDLHECGAIEDCMRDDIFHSTLDWQSRGELIAAAKQAEEILIELGELKPKQTAAQPGAAP